VLLLAFLMMLVLSGLAAAAAVFSQNSLATGKAYLLDQQAYYVAEAGQQRARQALVAGTWAAAASPGNTYAEWFPSTVTTCPSGTTPCGQYSVTIVDEGGGEYTVTSSGYVPNSTTYAARRQVAESEFSVTSSNGTNYSLTATASASSSDASNPASHAKDGSTSTKWKAGSNGSGWLAMDHGSAVTLNKIVVKEDANITGVSIEWSDNGTSWTTANGLSVVESPSKTWTATFTAASHRYFRASVSASSSKKPSVKEMEDYNSAISSLGTGEASTTW
jgi:hypothetical protein